MLINKNKIDKATYGLQGSLLDEVFKSLLILLLYSFIDKVSLWITSFLSIFSSHSSANE